MTWLGKCWNELKTVVDKKLYSIQKSNQIDYLLNQVSIAEPPHLQHTKVICSMIVEVGAHLSWSTFSKEEVGAHLHALPACQVPDSEEEQWGKGDLGFRQIWRNQDGWRGSCCYREHFCCCINVFHLKNSLAILNKKEISIAQYLFCHFMINKKIGPLYSSMWQQQGNWNGCGDLTLDHWTAWFFSSTRLLKYSGLVFFVASSLFSLLSKIIRPYNGVCPLSVVFNQTDLRVYLKSFINWYLVSAMHLTTRTSVRSETKKPCERTDENGNNWVYGYDM